MGVWSLVHEGALLSKLWQGACLILFNTHQAHHKGHVVSDTLSGYKERCAGASVGDASDEIAQERRRIAERRRAEEESRRTHVDKMMADRVTLEANFRAALQPLQAAMQQTAGAGYRIEVTTPTFHRSSGYGHQYEGAATEQDAEWLRVDLGALDLSVYQQVLSLSVLARLRSNSWPKEHENDWMIVCGGRDGWHHGAEGFFCPSALAFNVTLGNRLQSLPALEWVGAQDPNGLASAWHLSYRAGAIRRIAQWEEEERPKISGLGIAWSKILHRTNSLPGGETMSRAAITVVGVVAVLALILCGVPLALWGFIKVILGLFG